MLDTRPHVVEDAISDLAIGRTDVGGVSPFGCMAHLVVTAEFATPESAAFIVRHASGFMRIPAAAGICQNLQLPQMARHNENRQICVHSHGGRRTRVGTGIGARDRIAFRRTVTTAPVESPQARGRAGVAR